MVYERSFSTTGVAAGSPSRTAAGIHGNFFGRETGARGHRGIHLKRHCGPADGVLDAVQHIDHARNFLMASATRGAVAFRSISASCAKSLIDDRFRLTGQISDHVLQNLHELDF